MSENYVKFGWIRGGTTSVEVLQAASNVFKALSGRFGHIDVSGNFAVAIDGENEIFGHGEYQDGTSNATGGVEAIQVIIDPSAVFRIPIGAGVYATSMLGKTCDMKVTANIQGADLTANTDKIFIVVGGDVAGQAYVDVMINQGKRAQNGVV